MSNTDRLIAALALLVLLLAADSDWLQGVENAGYDLFQRLSPARPASPDVAVVAIDERALAEFGPWPWSRDILARAQRRITAAEPSAVAWTLSFEAANNERGLKIMGAFRDQHAADLPRRLRRLLQRAVNELDTDFALAASLRAAGNVVLGYPYELAGAGAAAPGPGQQAPSTPLLLDAARVRRYASWPDFLRPRETVGAARLYPPAAKIAAGAAWLAPSGSHAAARDGVRAVPLAIRYGDDWLPTLPLLALAAHRGVAPQRIEARAFGLQVGEQRIETDSGLRVRPVFYPGDERGGPFPVYSVAELLGPGAVDLRDKLVLVGLTAPRFTSVEPTPLGEPLAEVLVLAHTLSSLLQGDLYRYTEAGLLVRYLALGLVAAYLMLVAPRLRTATAAAVSGLLLVLLLNGEFLLMLLRSVWSPLLAAVVLLLAGHLLLAANRMLHRRLRAYQLALSDSNRLLGQTFQSQGQLEQAFAKYRQCVDSEEVIGLLYSLGLDYERKRQFNRAAEVFRHIARKRRRYRDIDERVRKNEALEQRLVIGAGTQDPASTLIIADNGLEKPVLGRYQVEREIGRGAMGMVYLGRDPKIGRTVAIKTMALDQEFDAENVAEVRQRFFREAETAGRLKHPHIVTIYDVGEERDLSYIAMDFIDGEPLSQHATSETLLPVARVLEIAAQVADALHYAHQNNVVHRDIKPGNIIYRPEQVHATVTDFGVACLTDASRTKTGTILGSPSYMSPEQLAGERVDGRSDLFSLGVSVFQLLTGQLPFVADSLSSLMYKIANEGHPDARRLRPDLPTCVNSIINRSLNKNPARRYANGAQMASALRRCQQKLADRGARPGL